MTFTAVRVSIATLSSISSSMLKRLFLSHGKQLAQGSMPCPHSVLRRTNGWLQNMPLNRRYRLSLRSHRHLFPVDQSVVAV